MSAPATVRSSAAAARSRRQRAKWWTFARVLPAFAVAPLAAAASAIAYVAVFDRWLWVEYPGVTLVATGIAFVFGGAGCVVGSALLFLLRWRRLWAGTALGFVLGAVPTVIWVVSQRENGEWFVADGLMPHEPFFPAVGALVAMVFWLVVFWRNPYYASQLG